uniref:uncharacterized protein LOC117609643 isoform X2 n=1 Tax=Osmia lignaria TaxID=473952 RepID=UPI001478CE1B|nr:uncharacterized protein LOC117609643 isoform X2 [Osmia lignaria]
MAAAVAREVRKDSDVTGITRNDGHLLTGELMDALTGSDTLIGVSFQHRLMAPHLGQFIRFARTSCVLRRGRHEPMTRHTHPLSRRRDAMHRNILIGCQVNWRIEMIAGNEAVESPMNRKGGGTSASWGEYLNRSYFLRSSFFSTLIMLNPRHK